MSGSTDFHVGHRISCGTMSQPMLLYNPENWSREKSYQILEVQVFRRRGEMRHQILWTANKVALPQIVINYPVNN